MRADLPTPPSPSTTIRYLEGTGFGFQPFMNVMLDKDDDGDGNDSGDDNDGDDDDGYNDDDDDDETS